MPHVIPVDSQCGKKTLTAQTNLLQHSLEPIQNRNDYMIFINWKSWHLLQDHYLRYAPDARSIVWLLACKNSESMIMRLGNIISAYNIEIKNISGQQNYLADYFSRMNIPTEGTQRVTMKY